MPGKVHPTQLYEAIFLFAIFAICYLLYWKKHFKHTMSLYLICYGIFRFSLEYLRGDHRGELVGGISPSQFWSILMVVIGVGVYFLLEWLFPKRAAEKAAMAALETAKEAETSETVEETETLERVEETPVEEGFSNVETIEEVNNEEGEQ